MTDLHRERSLIVDNVPPGSCTRACSLCGYRARSSRSRARRYDTQEAVRRVATERRRMHRRGHRADHLAVRPSAEPTLDRHLGALLAELRRFGLPVVVYTNGTTLHRDDVRAELSAADVVCLAVDAVERDGWLATGGDEADLERTLGGLRVFGSQYKGRVVSYTALSPGANTSPGQLEATADAIASLKPSVAYLGAREDHAPGRDLVGRAVEIFEERVDRVALAKPYGSAAGVARLHAPLRPARPRVTVEPRATA